MTQGAIGTSTERTTLVRMQPTERFRLTGTRTTDSKAAIQFGLKQYLEDLQIDFNGRLLTFKHVRQTWAEPEDDAEYPCAGIFSDEEGMYGDEDGSNTKLSPGLLGGIPLEGIPDAYATVPCELVQTFKVQIWTTDPKERTAICAMVEDALNPVDWMYGFKLRLPHYHGAIAHFEPLGSIYEENEEDSRRRFRKVTVRLKATVPVIRAFYGRKKGVTRIQVAVSDQPTGFDTGFETVGPGVNPDQPVIETVNPFRAPGPPGPRGPVGPEGPSSTGHVPRVADGPLSAHRVLKATSDTLVGYCDALTPSDVQKGYGISVNAAGDGDTVYVAVTGELSEPSWTWVAGSPIFCGNDGVLTQVDDPAWAWIRIVAVAETATKIQVQFRDPIAR